MGPLNKRNTPIVKMRKGSQVERLDTKNAYRKKKLILNTADVKEEHSTIT